MSLRVRALTVLASASLVGAVLAGAAGSATADPADDVVSPGGRYAAGFDDLPLGLVNDEQIEESFDSRYAKGPDEGRVRIVSDGHRGRAGRVTYPAYANQSSPSGATWETDLTMEAERLYLSYWVKFDRDFQFVKGGKLPGLAGSAGSPSGANEFTTRLMWREDGKLEFYLHGYQVDNRRGAEPYRVAWDGLGRHARVRPGQWHHIEIQQVLNTPGRRDGRLLGWLDGRLRINDTDNSGVRGPGQAATKLNQVYFSTFFGGSSAPESQWQPTRDVHATFDEFVVGMSRGGVRQARSVVPGLVP